MNDQRSEPLPQETPPPADALESGAPGGAPPEEISATLIQTVCERLASNKPVRRRLPGGGQLNVDRMLPFLCVYRRNPARGDAGTELFVHPEAAFLNAPGVARVRKGLRELVRQMARTVAERAGGFLILELWSGLDSDVPQLVDSKTGELELPRPAFRILTRVPHRPEGTCATLAYNLQRIRVHRHASEVAIDLHAENHPPQMTELLSLDESRGLNCHVVGLEIRPIYRDRETGELYPDVLKTLRRGVGRALKKAFFAFSLNQTRLRPQHFFALARQSLPKVVYEVDRELAEVSSQFKFLLQVTPINSERSWYEFRDSKYRAAPLFQYRPLDCDPLMLKRRLLEIPTERVEDPTLAHLLRQTQDELDRQITMLSDIRTERFLPGSLQVFGRVAPELLRLADEILQLAPRGEASADCLDAKAFAERASLEIEHYRRQLPGFSAQAIIREDMYTGLLCSGGNLLIGRETSIPAQRVDALLQHEVGTHLVTYYNGKQQPLGLLRVGLAGYDGLQEGLAVLAEYLVGGLNRARLRLLAARVVAVHEMIAGVAFSETFQRLVDAFGFEPRTAYTIVLRVHRGGGLTKDAVYLRGLRDIVLHLRQGGELEPLLVGKIAVDHIPVIRELQHREVLRPAALRPRYLDLPATAHRLQALREKDTSVERLIELAESG